MYVPKEYFIVLQLVYDNKPLLTNGKTAKNFLKKSGYKPGRFQQIVDELVDKGLIVISADYDDGKKQAIENLHGEGPFEPTFDGSAYVEHYKKKNRDFWIPIFISSTISIASIIASILISCLN